MNSNTTESSSDTIQPTLIVDNHQPPLSSLLIGIIIISVIAGIGLLSLSILFVRKRNNNNSNKNDMESLSLKTSATKKRVFSFSSSSNNDKEKDQHNSNIPVTSSLDNHDVFSTLLEYPPTQPPTSLQNNRQLDLPINNYTSSSYSVYEDRRKNLKSMKLSDPISASLVRQSIEERSGYYKSPTRTPVPYYQHQNKHSSSIASSTSNNLVVTITEDEDDDEDKKAMQRWSTTSYHVW